MSNASDRSVRIGHSSQRPVPFVEPGPHPSTQTQTKKNGLAFSVGQKAVESVGGLSGDPSTGSKEGRIASESQSGAGTSTGTRRNDVASLDEGEIPEDPDTLREMVKELRRERRAWLTERSKQFSNSEHTSDRRWSAGTRTTAPPGYEE
jgi:hypothetical protein